MHHKKAFTLIELLIVVAIIGVLAAIAVPNFLEAQTRAKVSRTMGDMRSLVAAVETYRIDYNYYPLPAGILLNGLVEYPMTRFMHSAYRHNFAAGTVTTPISYISSLPNDPFAAFGDEPMPENETYYFMNYDYTYKLADLAGATTPPPLVYRGDRFGNWVMFACGPDRDRKDLAPTRVGVTGLVNAVYDPTNGTVSNGDVIRTQRAPNVRAFD